MAEVSGRGLGRQLGPKSCLLRINRRGPRPLSINDWFTIPKDRSFQAPASAASDMTTTAEGVETEQQRNLLSILGCTEVPLLLREPAGQHEVRRAAEDRRAACTHRFRSGRGCGDPGTGPR